MHLPKYSNPHFAVDATRVVSRKTLQLQDEGYVGGGGECDVELGRQEAEGLRAKLEEIIAKRLKLKRVLTPSGDSRPNKRCKTLVEEGEGKPVEPQQTSEPVDFRLVSKSLPPRTIYLTPKPPKVVPIKEPPCEDTKEEFKERTYRSALSAVDLELISQTFSMANDPKPPRPFKMTSHARATTAPLLLLEIPRIAPLPPTWMNQRFNVPPKPSPHQLPNNITCCPTVLLDPSHHRDNQTKKGRRRRGKPKNKNKLVP